jgi:SagB-type dehydrogenase family enzyme
MQDTGRKFMEMTRFENLEAPDQMLGRPHPPLEAPCLGEGEIIDLPGPSAISVRPLDLRDAIEHRRSIRSFSEEPLKLAELAYLLWCTQGVQENVEGQFTFRTVPSAGARHALETFLLVNRVEGVTPGLYRYLALEHQLAEIDRSSRIADRIGSACLHQSFITRNAVTFFWVAVAYRMAWRYGQRGYRYLHLDAGHVCQNLYLAAEAVGCGTCAVGAFHDADMNAALGLDGEDQFLIYLASVGKLPE